MLAQSPRAMQLRYLRTLAQIAGDRSSTVVFPLPVELFAHLRPEAAREQRTGE